MPKVTVGCQTCVLDLTPRSVLAQTRPTSALRLPTRWREPTRSIAGSLRSAGTCFRPQAGSDPAIASATYVRSR